MRAEEGSGGGGCDRSQVWERGDRMVLGRMEARGQPRAAGPRAVAGVGEM